MGETLMQRVTGRVDNVGRRIEIGFPDLKMDDVAPLSLQGPRLNQNFEGGLGAETRHTLGEAEFPSLSHDGEISIITALAQLVFFVDVATTRALCHVEPFDSAQDRLRETSVTIGLAGASIRK